MSVEFTDEKTLQYKAQKEQKVALRKAIDFQRQAQALRDNLKRRKQQQHALRGERSDPESGS